MEDFAGHLPQVELDLLQPSLFVQLGLEGFPGRQAQERFTAPFPA